MNRHMRAKKQRLVWLSLVFIVVFLAGYGAMWFEVHPDGCYRNDKVGSEGLAFYELSDGVVRLIVLSEDRARVNVDKHVGVFSKRDGQWVLTDVAGVSSKIRASVLWLKVYHDNAGSPEIYNRVWGKVRVER